MEVRIRPAETGDADAIAAIWNQIIAGTDKTFNSVETTASDIAALLEEKKREGHPFLVAEAGPVAGFATYGQFRPSIGYVRTMEHTIVLDAGARRRGIGRKLMEAIEAHAARSGVHSLIAGISGTNRDAISFHRSLGYEEVGKLREVGRKLDRWHDLVLMQKLLAEGRAARKSVWSRLASFLSRGGSEGPWSGSAPGRPSAPRDNSLTFMVAVIFLGVKLAKADGRVTRDEVAAFRRVFVIDEAGEKLAGKAFNVAKQSSVGYEFYARQAAKHFGPGNRTLDVVLEGLFIVAAADGEISSREEQMLRRIAEIFGCPEGQFKLLVDRYAASGRESPYKVLGVSPDAPTGQIRTRWRKLVRENHPDALVGKGVPHEAAKLAESRLAAINRAWDEIRAERGASA